MPKLMVNGVDLNFVLEGPEGAEVLTFVHGQAFDLKSWTRQKAEFKRITGCFVLTYAGMAELKLDHLKQT